jgi:peptidyl-prolyl cis-trans isomerase SurA
MKKRSLALLVAVFTLVAVSCSSMLKTANEPSKGKPIGQVGEQLFYNSDLNLNYQPISGSTDTLADKIAFLPSFLLYQAKIAEARRVGLFENESLNKEYQDFGTRAAFAYWIENDIKEQMLNDFIKKSEEELLVSYMLINLSENSPAEDTLAAYNKLLEARQKVLDGGDFDSLSVIYSTKLRGKTVGGELYYLTAGATVKPFEETIYSQALNTPSMPFRSQYGMHLSYVKDRRERKRDREVSHIILFDRSREYKEHTVDSLIGILDGVYEQLQNGAPWDSLVQTYSMDASSRNNGGKIGWINNGRYNKVFSDTVMNMNEKPGYLTKPFYSGYGVQILRLDSIRTFTSESEKRTHYENLLKDTPSYTVDESVVRSKVKSKLSISIDSTGIDNLLTKIIDFDSTRIKALELSVFDAVNSLITVGGKTYSEQDIVSFFKDRYPELFAAKTAYTMINELENDAVDDHILEISRSEFKEFDQTMNNYKNGLAVFKITEDSVWNYAKLDTNALMSLYEKKRFSYQLPERVEFIRFASISDSLLLQGVNAFQLNPSISLDSLTKDYPRLIVRHDSTSYLNEEPFIPLSSLNTGEYSDIYSFKGRKTIIFKKQILPSRPMTFDEAIYRVISDLQIQREKEWNESLNMRYQIRPFPNAVNK